MMQAEPTRLIEGHFEDDAGTFMGAFEGQVYVKEMYLDAHGKGHLREPKIKPLPKNVDRKEHVNGYELFFAFEGKRAKVGRIRVTRDSTVSFNATCL